MDTAVYDANRLASSRSKRQPEFPTTTQSSFQPHRFCHAQFSAAIPRSFSKLPLWSSFGGILLRLHGRAAGDMIAAGQSSVRLSLPTRRDLSPD